MRGHRSAGEWLLQIVSSYDLVVTLLNNSLCGSIPLLKEVRMAKFKVLLKTAVHASSRILSHWVTKATLLVLSYWCLPQQPYVFSSPARV